MENSWDGFVGERRREDALKAQDGGAGRNFRFSIVVVAPSVFTGAGVSRSAAETFIAGGVVVPVEASGGILGLTKKILESRLEEEIRRYCGHQILESCGNRKQVFSATLHVRIVMSSPSVLSRVLMVRTRVRD
jgi:hypothetical protein